MRVKSVEFVFVILLAIGSNCFVGCSFNQQSSNLENTILKLPKSKKDKIMDQLKLNLKIDSEVHIGKFGDVQLAIDPLSSKQYVYYTSKKDDSVKLYEIGPKLDITPIITGSGSDTTASIFPKEDVLVYSLRSEYIFHENLTLGSYENYIWSKKLTLVGSI
ncbi:MAG: hypothetical protein ACRCXZ_09065 [Patescibacteria group bacterium]